MQVRHPRLTRAQVRVEKRSSEQLHDGHDAAGQILLNQAPDSRRFVSCGAAPPPRWWLQRRVDAALAIDSMLSSMRR